MDFWKNIFRIKKERNTKHSNAKNLKNLSENELFDLITSSDNNDEYKSACTSLGQLLKESEDQQMTQALINLLSEERSRYKRDNLLHAIGYCYKGPVIDVSSIFDIVKKYKQYSILEKAISALRNYSNQSIDEIMNYLLEESNDEYILTMVNATINKYGNRNNNPFLRLNLDRKGKGTADTVASAMLALVSVGDVREQDLFIDYLNKGRLKSEALEGLCLHGNELAILPILIWTRSRIKRKPKRLCGTLFFNQKLPIQIALEFLDKYIDNNTEIQEFYKEFNITSSNDFTRFS